MQLVSLKTFLRKGGTLNIYKMLDDNSDNISSEDTTEDNTSNSKSAPDTSEVVKEDAKEMPSNEEATVETTPVSKEDVPEPDSVNDLSEKSLPVEEKIVEEVVTSKEEVVTEDVVSKEKTSSSKLAPDTSEVVKEDAKEMPSNKEATLETAPVSKEDVPKPNPVNDISEKTPTIVEEAVTSEESNVIEENADDKEVAVEEKEAIVKETKEEEKTTVKEVVVEKIDYTKLDLEQLVTELKKRVKSDAILEVKDDIEKIKLSFNIKFGELLQEKKKVFIDEGGNEIDFYYSSPIKSIYNDLLFEFKTKRQNYYKQLEAEQKENLSKRLVLIEELKHLIDNAEPSTMYNQFRDLQQRWRAIGRIPKVKYNDVWRTFHHHVERFYDLLHLSNDFRDLDFKHNLEEKLKLVEKAEALAEGNDLGKAFKELQVLHKRWKEDIGPVGREHREEIWERFSKATKKIHEQRHELQKKLESKYEDNIVLKRDIIDKINTLVVDEIDSHRLWQQKIKELEALRQAFFKIGRVPRAVNEKVWNEFKDATRNFNKIKNFFYKNVKKGQHENLTKKNALVERAEALKDSEDWDTATEVMKQIQAEWKTIGHVPRKYSDKIWKRFKDACNHYFDRLHGVQDEANKEQVEAFNKKKELLENFKSQAEKNKELTLEVINSYVDDWHKLGKLPNNMRHIETKFNKMLNGLYSKLNLDEAEISMLKFKNVISNYITNNDLRKIDNEQLFIRKKIDELTREIQQLENNISFISNASDDNPLLKNVRSNIENYNKQLAIWKSKLEYITSLDY